MKLANQFFLIIAVAGLYSCENVVEIDVPQRPPQLVLNTYITSDSLWYVNLSHSKNVLDNSDYKEIADAQVSIFEDGELVEVLDYQEVSTDNGNSRLYKSDNHRPQPGKVYRVEAQKSGYQTVWAETTLPDPVLIEDLTIDTSKIITRDYSSGYKLSLTFNDPADIRNYYQVELFAKTTRSQVVTYWDEDGNYKDSVQYYTDFSSIYIEALDPSISEEQYGYGNTVNFTDGRFNGSSYQFDFLIDEWWVEPFINNSSSDEEALFEIVLRNINEAIYLYETTADLQDWYSGDPFSEPVPVYSNIENGYGVLGAYASDKKSLSLKK